MALSWVTLLVLLLLIIVLMRSNLGIYNKNMRASERASDAQSELLKIQEREAVLDKNLTHIKTTKGVEEELRRKFDVAREGEHLLVIVDKEVEVTPPVIKDSLWSKFIGIFK